MAWTIQGSRAYEIHSIRRGRKVTSVYLGGGSISAESALFFRQLEAGRRAEREAAREAWEAERGQLVEVERRFIEMDEAYDELAEAALYATGHHRPSRGRWRKRRTRTMASTIQTTPTDPPLVSEAEMGDLLDRLDRADGEEKKNLQNHIHQGIQLLLKHARLGVEAAVPALRVVLARRPQRFGNMEIFTFAARATANVAASNDSFLTDVLLGEIRRTASEVAGPNPTPVERLLAERVALTWFDAHQADCKFLEATGGEGCSIAKADYLVRLRDRSNSRFLAACRSLAVVRKLALPTLQLHLNAPAANVPECAVEPTEVPAPRLRLRGQS
jgi:hypothetical protein